jgi:hypothetical protein
MKNIKSFFGSKRGEVSVKGLAMTVGIIVLIGFIVVTLQQGLLKTWVEDVWTTVWTWIQDSFMKGGAV